MSVAALVAVMFGANGSGAGAGSGAFAAETFTDVATCDDLSRFTRDCRSDPRLAAAAIGTNGIIKSENESRQAINTLISRLVSLSESRAFIGFSWVRT
jgi:hypothetical protein